MKLMKLSLRNFKGIKSFDFEPGGNDAEILGENASGKTTVVDGFMWLLFGKDSQNKADFQIKTINKKGDVTHNLEHEVEGVIFTDKEITLKKVYAEKWTKKRGSATSEFTGHTTDHFVDGVPVSKSEYQNRVAEIAPEETFRLLTDPRFFNEQLHWQKRREILLDAFGDVTDADIIAGNPKLKQLPAIIGDRKLEDHRKVIHGRRSEINKELDRIPVRIDEASRSLPDIADLSKVGIEKTVAGLTADIKKKETEISRIETGGQVAELRKELRIKEAEFLDTRNNAQKGIYAQIQKKQSGLSKLVGQADDLGRQISSFRKQIEINETELTAKSDQLSRLRELWKKINSELSPDDSPGEAVCPTCGQDLPEDQVQAATEKAVADYNELKAGRLSDNVETGKKTAAVVQQLKNDNTAFESQIAGLETDKTTIDQQIENLKKEIADLEKTKPDPKPPAEIADIERQIDVLKAGTEDQIKKIQEEILNLRAARGDQDDTLSEIRTSENLQRRIKDLEDEQKKLAAEFEKLESELNLCDEFTRAKVKVLEERINDKFKIAKFKMFEVQVNGGLAECCNAMVDGVPYSSMNNAARINSGLDIISTLSGIYEFSAPIFCDNAEAVNELFPVEAAQMIRLTVAKNKILKVNINEQKGD